MNVGAFENTVTKYNKIQYNTIQHSEKGVF